MVRFFQRHNLLSSLVLSMRWAVISMAAGALLIYLLLPDWHAENQLLHSQFEGAGAVISIILVFIVLGMVKIDRFAANYKWLAASFIAMGTLDIAHALVAPGQAFVWLHSWATFVGGLFAALIWLPAQTSLKYCSNRLLILIFSMTTLFSLFSISQPEYTIAMLDENHHFTDFAKFLNMAGGFGFMSAWAYFTRLYYKQQDPEASVFSNHYCLFSLAALLFEASILWDGNWWHWHILRAFAYIFLLFHFGDRYWQDLLALVKSNRKLLVEIGKHQETVNKLNLSASVFSHTSEAIIIIGPQLQIIECNQAVIDITGFSGDELLGKSINNLIATDQVERFKKDIWLQVQGHGHWSGEVMALRKSQQSYPIQLSINAASITDTQLTHYIVVFSDITQLKENQKKLSDLAFYDVLTGLANRQLFLDRLDQSIKLAMRNQNRLALLFIDVDRFKEVNDTLGHPVGDHLLQEIAKRLSHLTRSTDTVARIGGDEFTIILNNPKQINNIIKLVENVIEQMSQPFVINNNHIFVGASVGISLYPDDGTDKDTLMREADAAMYHAKQRERGSFQFFSEQINQHNQKRRKIETELRLALQHKQFELYYQPQINVEKQKVTAVEALIRWNHPEQGMVSPAEFIPIAEETGIIIEIGEWVFREACRKLRRQIEQGEPNIQVAINLSAVQLADENFLNKMEVILDSEQVLAESIEIEITESSLMENKEQAGQLLKKIAAMGFTIAIDDFGTGYSSLAYLKHFPVHRIKIDRSFVEGLPDSENDVILTRTMIMLAENLGMQIIAEGAEHKAQVDFLLEQGCKHVQGYFYSRPLSETALQAYLKDFSKGG